METTLVYQKLFWDPLHTLYCALLQHWSFQIYEDFAQTVPIRINLSSHIGRWNLIPNDSASSKQLYNSAASRVRDMHHSHSLHAGFNPPLDFISIRSAPWFYWAVLLSSRTNRGALLRITEGFYPSPFNHWTTTDIMKLNGCQQIKSISEEMRYLFWYQWRVNANPILIAFPCDERHCDQTMHALYSDQIVHRF